MSPVSRKSEPGQTSSRVERAWLVDEIRSWLRSTSTALLVTGSPGTGKTDALAQFAREPSVVAAHFLRSRDDRLINPLRVVEKVSTAIAEAVPAFRTALLRDPFASATVEVRDITVQTGAVTGEAATVAGVVLAVGSLSAREAFDRHVRRPWEDMPEADRVTGRVVVVDALDESLSWPGSETAASLLAAAVAAPPQGLRFVISARPLPELVSTFPTAHRLDLDEHQDESRRDVRRFVARHPSLADPEGVIRAADGNLLVATYLVRAPGLTAGLPSGVEVLRAVYREFVDRELRLDRLRWRRELRPLLATLGVLRGVGALTDEIALLMDLPHAVVRDALLDCGSFAQQDPAGRWRLYHESFRDYLVSDEEIGSGPEQDLAVAQRLVSLFPDWWRCETTYAIQHVAGHLLAAITAGFGVTRGADLLAALACDARWLVRRASMGDAEQLLVDLKTAAALEGAAARESMRTAAAVLDRQAAAVRARAEAGDAARLAQQLALGALSVEPSDREQGMRRSARDLAVDLGAPFVDADWMRGPRQAALRTVIPAHSGDVLTVAVAPDASRAFSVGDDDEKGRLWDLATGRELLTVPGVYDAEVAWPAGVAYVIDQEGDLVQVDLTSGRQDVVRRADVELVQLSDDGRRLLVMTDDAAEIFDTESLDSLLSVPVDAETTVMMSSNGGTLVVMTSGRLSLVTVDGSSWTQDLPPHWGGRSDGGSALAISADGRLVAWSGFRGGDLDDFIVHVQALDDRSKHSTWRFDAPSVLTFDVTGRRLFVCGRDNSLTVMDTGSGKELLHRTILTGDLNSRIALPSGDLLGNFAGEIYILPSTSGRETVSLSGPSRVSALTATPDGHACLTGHADGDIRVWDLDRAVAADRPGTTAAVVEPGGSRVWATDTTGGLQLLELADGSVTREHRLDPMLRVHGCASDGSTLVLSLTRPHSETEIVVLDAATGAELHRWAAEYPDEPVVLALPFGAQWLIGIDSNYLFCRLYTGDGRPWPKGAKNVAADVRLAPRHGVLVNAGDITHLRTPDGRSTHSFTVRTSMITLPNQETAVSGDGSTAIVQDYGLRLLDLQTGRIRRLKRTSDSWYALALDYSGTRLIAAGLDEAVILSTRTSRVLRRLPPYTGLPHLGLSGGPGRQRVCLATTSGELLVQSLDDEDEQWTCWLDSPLRSATLIGDDAVVGVDSAQRLVVLRLVQSDAR